MAPDTEPQPAQENAKPLPPPKPAAPTRVMRRSDSIAKLVKALAAAQGQMEPAVKDSVNTFFSTNTKQSTYASLGSIWRSCRKPLSSNGIAVIQVVRTGMVSQSVEVETTLAFEEEWVAETLQMPASQIDKYGNIKFDAQTVKSASTYCKRISLEGMAGVAVKGEDDDADAVSEGGRPQEQASPAQATPAQGGNAPAGLNEQEKAALQDFCDLLEMDATSLVGLNGTAMRQYYETPKDQKLLKSMKWDAIRQHAKKQGWKWIANTRDPNGGMWIESRPAVPVDQSEF
jgi:hypothetical protein